MFKERGLNEGTKQEQLMGWEEGQLHVATEPNKIGSSKQ